MQIVANENEMSTIEVNDVGKFGFLPSLSDSSDSRVHLRIFDIAVAPRRELGAIDLTVGGDMVETKTDPAFGVKVLQVKRL